MIIGYALIGFVVSMIVLFGLCAVYISSDESQYDKRYMTKDDADGL